MKKILLFIVIISYLTGYSQNSKTITINGTDRHYLEYISPLYNDNKAVPLIICLHGLGDDMNNFSGVGFQYIGMVDNFITIYPQAKSSIMGNAWNAGVKYYGISLNAGVNDVEFLNMLIDSIKNEYNIDTTRIYFMGFSLGAFMAHRMACEYGHRIAAIASVAGTMGNNIVCNPTKPMPICHFHGTNDQTIPYTNNPFGVDVDSLIRFWTIFNNTEINPIITELPDIANDDITISHYLYNNSNNGAIVELFKANGADHQWLYPPANDINYTNEIWNFLKQFKLTSSLNENYYNNDNKTIIYPNPFTDYLYIKSPYNAQISIINYLGQEIKTDYKNNEIYKLQIDNLKQGTYFISIKAPNNKVQYQKLIKN